MIKNIGCANNLANKVQENVLNENCHSHHLNNPDAVYKGHLLPISTEVTHFVNKARIQDSN